MCVWDGHINGTWGLGYVGIFILEQMMDTTNEVLLACVQAEIEGTHKVQIFLQNSWFPKNPDAGWNTNCTYRIKPEPREWWINEYPDGDLGCFYHASKKQAKKGTTDDIRQVHIREVLDDE